MCPALCSHPGLICHSTSSPMDNRPSRRRRENVLRRSLPNRQEKTLTARDQQSDLSERRVGHSNLRSIPEGNDEAKDSPAPTNGSVHVPTGNESDPAPSNGHATEVPPPPGLENAPPLSETAQSSFASAANGVASSQTENQGGQVVLNGTN